MFITAFITFRCLDVHLWHKFVDLENIDRIVHRNTQLPGKAKFIRLPRYYISVNIENGIN